MNITVFGGTGFIGSHITEHLIDHGHMAILLSRRGTPPSAVDASRIRTVTGTIDDDSALIRALDGSDAVIYNIGIIRELPERGITFEHLHYDGLVRTVDAAKSRGVRRFILMSANGAKKDGTPYHTTKYHAEEHLKSSGLDWTIFRPSVVYGNPHDRMEFMTQIYSDIVLPPFPAPLFFTGFDIASAGRFRLSPVHVDDVAETFVRALDTNSAICRTFTLGGPDETDWRTIIETIASACGRRKMFVPVPAWAVRTAAALFDRFSFFPVTRDQITMLMEGNVCDGSQAFELFGIEPSRFSAASLSYLGKSH